MPGDGYKGKPSPHTEHELFNGISVLRAAQVILAAVVVGCSDANMLGLCLGARLCCFQLAERKALTLEAAQLYYDLSERVRQQVAAYFKLDHLYFDYTHLVCRTALKGEECVCDFDELGGYLNASERRIPDDCKSCVLTTRCLLAGGQEKRGDISHPIHADNCILHNDSRCVKEPPAYTWRDYSAIMYLNSDFEGGQFVMTDQTARRVMVSALCGHKKHNVCVNWHELSLCRYRHVGLS